MKYLYTIFALILCHISFAQQPDLYVSNNSYIYVDGTAFTSGPNVAPLFVNSRIQLAGVNSYIYLRNEAQLLQSNSIGNEGVGKLSVYQTGTSNTYMYNYWCSPVGNTDGSNTANRSFRANNNLYDHIGHTNPALDPITSVPAAYTTGYDGTATAAPNPQIISSYWLYTYNPGLVYADWDHVGENGIVNFGYGFTMKGNSSNSQQYDFRGKPNNGTISTEIRAGQETLVGNPYPSALDSRAYIHDFQNRPLIDLGTLMFWEQNPTGSTSHVLVNYRGGYSTYTINATDPVVETFLAATFDSYRADGTLNTTGGPSTSGKLVRRYIPVGQGFMIKGRETIIGLNWVRPNNTMRTFQKESAGDSEFFKTTSGSSTLDEGASYTEDGLFIMPEGYMRFRLNIDFNETYTRQLLQNFHHTATPGEDYGLETISPEALNSDVYWPQNGKSLNAQANSFDMDLRIPLVISAAQNQPIRFRIFDIQNFDEDQPIFIHDIQNGVYVNLRENNYEINLPQGTYTDRFEITFTADALNIDQVVTIDDLNIYQNNPLAELSIANPKLLEVKQVSLYDVSGKQIFNEKQLNIEAKYRFSTKNLSQGVYIAHVTFADNQVVSKKVVVSNK